MRKLHLYVNIDKDKMYRTEDEIQIKEFKTKY